MSRLFSYNFFPKKSSAERRVCTIAVTADALLGLFQLDGTRILQMTGVPDDAKVETMWVEPDNRTLFIAISSESFEPLPEGMIPTSISIDILVTTLPLGED